MRFALTCTDRYLGVFQTLVQGGWQPARLFTTPVDHRIHENKAVLAYAAELGIPVHFSRLGESDLAALAADGVSTLVVASYNWKIPDWRPHLRYALNFHPSPLPIGRGPYPLVNALLEGLATWGVTCHQLTDALDAGPVLVQERFPLAADESHDSLDLKVQLAAKRLAARVATELPTLWESATPQVAAEGCYWRHWNEADRTLDFSQALAAVQQRLRAFGRIECIAVVNEVRIFVRRAVGWPERHTHRPGAVVHVDGDTLVVAVPDGLLAILEWNLLDPAAHTGTHAGNIRR